MTRQQRQQRKIDRSRNPKTSKRTTSVYVANTVPLPQLFPVRGWQESEVGKSPRLAREREAEVDKETKRQRKKEKPRFERATDFTPIARPGSARGHSACRTIRPK